MCLNLYVNFFFFLNEENIIAYALALFVKLVRGQAKLEHFTFVIEPTTDIQHSRKLNTFTILHSNDHQHDLFRYTLIKPSH